MHSRAYLLIDKEIEYFKNIKPWGIELIKASADSNFKWFVKMKGPENTDWNGGIFSLSLEFDECFNDVPPIVRFCKIPFHPNVDPDTGTIAIPLLVNPNAWDPKKHNLINLLEEIRYTFHNPNKHYIANKNAADLLQNNSVLYRRLVQECVQKSLQIEEEDSRFIQQTANKQTKLPNGLTIEYEKTNPELERRKEKQKLAKKFTSKVSFDEYLATWSGIATSKAKPEDSNSHLQLIQNRKDLVTVHNCLPMEEIESQLIQKMEQHRSLVYGTLNFKKKSGATQSANAKNMDKIDQMRKMYASQRTYTSPMRNEPSRMNIREPTSTPINELLDIDDPGDNEEEDVNELIKWSETLDQTVV